MKDLLKLNITHVHDDYSASLTRGAKPFNLANYYSKASFLPHCLSLFSTIPLIRNDDGLVSMHKTVKALPDVHTTTEGDITKAALMDLIMFTSLTNRSSLAAKAATKDPTLGGLTPLFMYAHKLYNDVQYSEWSRRDKYIMYALGKFLATNWTFISGYKRTETEGVNDKHIPVTMINYTWNDTLVPKPDLDYEKVKLLRNDLMVYASGANAGIIPAPTIYKMRQCIIDGVKYPSSLLIMELQTWIANVDLRNTESMLLDMWDWGSTPAPWDVKIDKPITPHVDPGRRSLRVW